MAKFAVLTLVLTLVVLGSLSTPIFCATSKDVSAIAVGIDLTPSRGTLSIQLKPGVAVPVVSVEGSEAYKAMIARLALPSSRHMAPPYEYWHDGGALMGLDDIPRRKLRMFRKSIGLPASRDAGTISEMLTALIDKAVEALKLNHVAEDIPLLTDSTMSSIVITSPELDALYDEELQDAAEFSGLKLLYSDWYARQPKHIYAYYNAYKLPTNLSAPPWPHGPGIMLASLSQNGLEVSQKVKTTNRTCKMEWAQQWTWYSTKLGADSTLDHDEAERRNWTAQVKELVFSCARERHQNQYGYFTDTSHLLFAGESGRNAIFQKTILEAIKEYQPDAPEVIVWPRSFRPVDSKAVNENLQPAHVFDNGEPSLPLWEFGGSQGAASMAWDMLHARLPEPPSNYSLNECAAEWRGEDSHNIKTYGVTFWDYLIELMIDGGWAVWRRACCSIAPVCPLPVCSV